MHEILYIERKFDEFVSLEKVFRQIAKNISEKSFKTAFQQVLYDNRLSGIIKNLLFFRKKKADIYHITGHIHYLALVLPKKKTVLTIHDLRILHTRKGFRRYILKKLFLDLPLKKLQYITAISEATKQEIIQNTKCRAEKIRVIENPIQDGFLTTAAPREFNENCPTILQIGTMENKNIPNLAKALQGIKCHLKIIGRLSPEQISILKENGILYENELSLDDAAIIKAYQKADLVAFCSTYEGFGLPVIEAQAMGKPLLTSNISPLREVAGEGGFLADPFEVSSIREGLLKIIGDKKFRERIVRRGRENIERFDPQLIARKYENLYREILSEKN